MDNDYMVSMQTVIKEIYRMDDANTGYLDLSTEYVIDRIKKIKPMSCDGCHYLANREFNEHCEYCCRGKSDRYMSEEEYQKEEEDQ